MKKNVSLILMACILSIGMTGCNTTKSTAILETTNSEPKQSKREELLASQLSVPERYEATYTSDTGITVIHVDAKVDVPAVTSVNILEAIPRAFTEEEVNSFIARHSEELSWINQRTKKTYQGDGIQIDPADNSSKLDFNMYSLWINNEEEFAKGSDYYSIRFNYGINDKNNELAWQPRLEYNKSRYNIGTDQLLPLTDEKAAGCTISLQKAIEYADAEIHAISPDYQMTNYGQIPVYDSVDNPHYYIFRYTRNIGGIPVNDDYGGESCDSEGEYNSGLGVITAIVRDDGVCYVEYDNPYDIGTIIQEDCKLLPFDQIMDIFSNIGLQSIQSLERYKELQENTMDVYKIKLGYMTVRQPDNVDSYYYIPVWDFYAHRTLFGTGGYAKGKEAEELWGNSEVTINAIDGTIIDRSYGY